MRVETYAEADRLLAKIPVERRGRYRDDLYERVAACRLRERVLARSRVPAEKDAVAFSELALLVARLCDVPPRALTRTARRNDGTARAKRVLAVAALTAMPHMSLQVLAVLFRRPGQHSTIIFWRDNATETERAEAEAVVNHWRASTAKEPRRG